MLPPWLRAFLVIGVLGASITFATFGYETLRLLTDGNPASDLLNALGPLTVGLVAAYLGVVCGWLAGGR